MTPNQDQLRQEIAAILREHVSDLAETGISRYDLDLLALIDREKRAAVKEALKRFFKKTQNRNDGGWIEISGFDVSDKYQEVLSEMFPPSASLDNSAGFRQSNPE